jgi:hypothetical protein
MRAKTHTLHILTRLHMYTHTHTLAYNKQVYTAACYIEAEKCARVSVCVHLFLCVYICMHV